MNITDLQTGDVLLISNTEKGLMNYEQILNQKIK